MGYHVVLGKTGLDAVIEYDGYDVPGVVHISVSSAVNQMTQLILIVNPVDTEIDTDSATVSMKCPVCKKYFKHTCPEPPKTSITVGTVIVGPPGTVGSAYVNIY